MRKSRERTVRQTKNGDFELCSGRFVGKKENPKVDL